MTATGHDYLDEVERLFLLSPVVHSLQIREREERLHEGFIRIRAVLTNGDVLEAFEFVVAAPNTVQTQTYRLHWQQGDGHLKPGRHIVRKEQSALADVFVEIAKACGVKTESFADGKAFPELSKA